MSIEFIMSEQEVWKIRHPRVCRKFAEFRNCKFVRCAYAHSQDSGNNNNINELKKEDNELQQQVKRLSEPCGSEMNQRIRYWKMK